MHGDDVNRPDNSTPKPGASKAPDDTEHLFAISFLEQLRPGGPWVLTAIIPDGSTETKTVRTAAEIDSFVREHNGKRNLYYSVNPTKTPMSKKAAKKDIAAIEYLLGDLDPRSDETSEQAKVRYSEQLNGDFQPKPTAIVDSGNGIQCLWRLDPPIPLDDGSEAIIADAEARSAALMERLGAKAGTQNIDRILRLPWTINVPNAAKLKRGRVACPTKLISFNGAHYSLDSFPLPQRTEQQERAHEERAESSAQPEGDKLERIIRLGENGEFKGDRSDAVWFVVCEMLRRGLPDRAIVSTLLDRDNKISAHVNAQGNPRKYAEQQVVKAKAKNPPPKVEVLPESQWFGEKSAAVPPALVKGIFPETGVATIGGQSGGGKSFQAIHLGVRLIPDCKQNFYIDKYRIKRHGGVVYFVLEGKPAFPLRVTTAFAPLLDKEPKFGEQFNHRLPFAWNTYSPYLFEKGPDALMKIVEREAKKMRLDFGVELVAVFLDTMGLAACFENEDKSAQVQKVVSGLSRLSDATGALAINVDHMGKDQEAGLRGTSAKRDCVETIVTCLINRDRNNKPINHRMQLFKVRDGEEGRIIPYRLKPIELGVDEDGDRISTCVVEWELDRPTQTKAPKKKQTDIALEQAINEVGLPAEPTMLRAAFYKYHGGKGHAANVAWNRAINNRLGLGEDGMLDSTIR